MNTNQFLIICIKFQILCLYILKLMRVIIWEILSVFNLSCVLMKWYSCGCGFYESFVLLCNYLSQMLCFSVFLEESLYLLTFLAFLSMYTPPEPPEELLPGYGWATTLENGTGTEYLIVCRSCTTTFDTLRNESLRRLATPNAERTPNVLSMRGWNVFVN